MTRLRFANFQATEGLEISEKVHEMFFEDLSLKEYKILEKQFPFVGIPFVASSV